MGIKVGWIDKVLGEISVKRDCYTMVQEAQSLRNHIEVMQQQIENAEHHLRKLEI